MADNAQHVDAHYGFGDLLDRIDAGLRAAGKDPDNLAVDDLAPVDAFHTRGRESTVEVATLAGLTETDRVLDVGCGLGGTARFLAENYNCAVTGIDLTHEYIAVGAELNERVGLADRVTLDHGSALELPYEDASFDVVWTEHAQMNIADKAGFYGEIARVLRPGGRFLFHDIFRGLGDTPVYPVPWAEEASLSKLATEQQARDTMTNAGLVIDEWRTKDEDSLAFFQAVLTKSAADGPPPVGIHLLMGDTAREKLTNYVDNVGNGRVTIGMGLAIRS